MKAAVVFRDFAVDGDPSSGVHEPRKFDIRTWAAAIEALNGDPATLNARLAPVEGRATPVYASRDSALSAAPDLPSGLTHIMVREGTALVLRSRTAFADDPLLPSGPRWGVVQRQDFDAEKTARTNATRDTGVLPLVVDAAASTGAAIVADIAPAVPGVTLSALSTVELIPSANNTGAVTLNVGGEGAWPVQRRDGSAVQPGDLSAGTSYLLRRRGSAWRLIGLLDSEVASPAALRGAQRRVTSQSVSLSATEIIVRLPPGVSPTIDASTLIDVLWPDAAWPVPASTILPLRIASSTGVILFSQNIRLEDHAIGPRPGATWTIAPPDGSTTRWREVRAIPTQADVDRRAQAADVSARFGASLLGHRSLAATRDAAVTGSLRLVLAEEPSASERITVLVPEDSPGTGLSITTPVRTRSVGTMTGSQTVPVATTTQFRAGDILTLQIHDSSWFRLRHWWASERVVADLQGRIRGLETDLSATKALVPVTVEQTGAALPARPAGARYVEWVGWDDPTARMQVGDRWFKTASPVLPGVPLAVDLRALEFIGDLSGATRARLKAELRRQFPALSALQYSRDGGSWQTLFGPPFAAGSIADLPVLAAGDHGLRFRYLNFLGAGEPSPDRILRAHGAAFVDDFTAALGWDAGLVSRDNWSVQIRANTGVPYAWTIASGRLRTSDAERNVLAIATVAMPSLVAPGGAGLSVAADVSRDAGTNHYAGISLGSISARLNGPTEWSFPGFATGALPAGQSGRARLRIEVSPDGATVRGFVNGEKVMEMANPYAGGADFRPGVQHYRPSGAQTGDSYIEAFEAGRVTA